MCLSIPHKIISIKDKTAKVQCGKKTHTLNVQLLPNVKKGEWVLAEGGFAVQKVSKKQAEETYKLLINIKK